MYTKYIHDILTFVRKTTLKKCNVTYLYYMIKLKRKLPNACHYDLNATFTPSKRQAPSRIEPISRPIRTNKAQKENRERRKKKSHEPISFLRSKTRRKHTAHTHLDEQRQRRCGPYALNGFTPRSSSLAFLPLVDYFARR